MKSFEKCTIVFIQFTTYNGCVQGQKHEIQKKAEEKLKESEEKFKDLFENANDLIQSVDKEKFLCYTSLSIFSLFGFLLCSFQFPYLEGTFGNRAKFYTSAVYHNLPNKHTH